MLWIYVVHGKVVMCSKQETEAVMTKKKLSKEAKLFRWSQQSVFSKHILHLCITLTCTYLAHENKVFNIHGVSALLTCVSDANKILNTNCDSCSW